MLNVLQEARVPSRLLTNKQIAALQRVASRIHEPPTQLVSIAALIPCDASAIASAPIETIDRNWGIVRLKDASGSIAEVALGHDCAMAVAAAADERLNGPLIANVSDRGIMAGAGTENRARELLAADEEEPITFTWSFELLRESVFANMADDGVAHHVVMAQAGYGIAHVESFSRDEMLFEQRAAADWWSYRLGLRPPSPFALIDESTRASVGRRGVPPFRPGRIG